MSASQTALHELCRMLRRKALQMWSLPRTILFFPSINIITQRFSLLLIVLCSDFNIKYKHKKEHKFYGFIYCPHLLVHTNITGSFICIPMWVLVIRCNSCNISYKVIKDKSKMIMQYAEMFLTPLWRILVCRFFKTKHFSIVENYLWNALWQLKQHFNKFKNIQLINYVLWRIKQFYKWVCTCLAFDKIVKYLTMTEKLNKKEKIPNTWGSFIQ